jgi:hypothetical protein
MHLMHMSQMHNVSCKQHIADIYCKGFYMYKIYVEILSLTNLIIKEKNE